MSIQPIDVPSLLRAITWLVIVIVAFFVFRRQLGDVVGILGRHIQKVSFGGVSLEFAQIPEMKPPQTLDTEIRQLDAGLNPQSGTPGLTSLLSQLQRGGKQDYIVIHLGSETSRRWLTSRLYLLAFLITLLDRQLCLVFVETVGGVRKHFVGLALPSRVRWALARAYSWLETAAAGAYGGVVGNPGTLQFDPATGFLPDFQLSQLVQQFLLTIRIPPGTPVGVPIPDAGDWIPLGNQMMEHAKWLDGARIERVLGNDLNPSYVTLLPNQAFSDLRDAVLHQSGHFVAIVDPDKTFRGLVDRSAVLERLAAEFSQQISSNTLNVPGGVRAARMG
jgi:hypothetical protein